MKRITDYFRQFKGINRIKSYNPIHPHCGPFNEVSDVKSESFIDEACRQHDIAYGRYQKAGLNPYLYFNEADRRLMEDLGSSWNPLAIGYREAFKWKLAYTGSFTKKEEGMVGYGRKGSRKRKGTSKKANKRSNRSRKRYKKRVPKYVKKRKALKRMMKQAALFSAPRYRRHLFNMMVDVDHLEHVFRFFSIGSKANLKSAWDDLGEDSSKLGVSDDPKSVNYISWNSTCRVTNQGVHGAKCSLYELTPYNDFTDLDTGGTAPHTIAAGQANAGWLEQVLDSDEAGLWNYSQGAATIETSAFITLKGNELLKRHFNIKKMKTMYVAPGGAFRWKTKRNPSRFQYDELANDTDLQGFKRSTVIYCVVVEGITGHGVTDNTLVGTTSALVSIEVSVSYKLQHIQINKPVFAVADDRMTIGADTIQGPTEFTQAADT